MEENNDLETDNSEEEEDEIMPTFKYARIGNCLTKILNSDTVKCAAAHPRFLTFGTYLGRVYLLDHQGNKVETLFNNQSCYTHTVAVNHISIDNKGEYIATCSDDGKVVITGLYNDEDNQKLILGKAVKSVALNPDIKSGIGKKFIVGDKNLTLYETTFLTSSKTTVLSKSDNYISAIAWNNQYIAWTSNADVRVYDLNEKCSLGVMKWEQPVNSKLEKFRCNLKWSNTTTLLIGWADTIRIYMIRKRNPFEGPPIFLFGTIVDPIATLQTSFYVSGLAPLDTNQLVVLGYSKELDRENNGKALRPILYVLKYESTSYEEICADTLSIRGYQEYWVNDYYLDCIIEENRYFIISPKDVVVASLYGTDDQIQWYIDQRKFSEALNLLANYNSSKYPVMTINRLHIDHLISRKKYDKAAQLCHSVLRDDKSLWEEEIYKFVKVNQLRAISAYLPISKECQLDKHVYEMVLFEYLKMDKKGFLKLIKEWEPTLYDSTAVINAVKDNYVAEFKNELLESLAILYAYSGEHDKSLALYLKILNKDIFKIIKKLDLYNVIQNLIVQLIELDPKLAVDLLTERTKMSSELKIPSEIVVKQLEQRQDYLCIYLDKLNKIDNSGKYDWKLLNLYAKYDQGKLLPFIRRSNNYPILEAFELCKNANFYEEMVYLLGRMGSTNEALNIIIHEIKNITTAIEFCKEHNDEDLWNCLIDESLKDPEYIKEVLNGIVGYVNPENLVNKIKIGEKIPNLKSSLIQMLCDYSLELSKKEVSNKIFLTDYFNLLDKLIKNQRNALYISNESYCGECRKEFFPQTTTKDQQKFDVIVFNCHHYFHRICLKEDFCTVCKPKQKIMY